MKCPSCQADNPDGMKYCGACGVRLGSIACAACHFSNPPGFRFCGGCGAALASSGSVTPSLQPDAAASTAVRRDAERRQLTVLFCDLVDSTAIAARLDPEDLGLLVRVYQAACARVVQRFDGYVAQYLGDGVLAYFGYPHAHEDDAERSVRAAVEIVEAVSKLNVADGDEKPIELKVRVGIATGLVVTGDLGGGDVNDDTTAVGQTLNLAARLQSVAQPNNIVLANDTQRLLGGVFEYDALELLELKGMDAPVRAWRVVRPARAASRFDAVHHAGLTPMVDREDETELILRRWARAKEGDGQVVLLSGEPGIGKSRVAQALRERIASESQMRLRYQCSPYYTNSPMHPVIENVAWLARFERDDSPDGQLDKLEALFADFTEEKAELVPLLAALLSIPIGVRYAPLDMSPQRQKDKTLEALVGHLDRLAARQPVLMVFEDVHWIDPTSMELLDMVVERARSTRVLVLITFRPEFAPPWAGQSHVTLISLNRLSRQDNTAMVGEVAGGKALPDVVTEQIVEKTDGVPLFVEELTKTMLESGLLKECDDRYVLTGALPPLAIPTTLKDSLMARLDQLALVKQVAQIGGAIGREFSFELMAAVSSLPAAQLREALDKLVESELVYCRGTPPLAIYVFKHALVQDAAYESLLRSRRQQLHARIGETLEKKFPEVAQTNPEILARHWTEAGLAENALVYWIDAGRRASERSANVEALSHLRKGLELLNTLPETEQRKQQKLTMLIALGPVLITTKGPGTPDVEEVYTQALALCAELPESPLHFAAMWGWSRISADFQTKRERADKLLALSERLGDSGLRLQAHHSLWASLFHLGQLEACCQHVTDGLKLYDVTKHRSHAAIYGGHDPRVCGHGETSLALWLLGFPDRALERIHEAMAGARKLRQSGSMVHAMDIATMLHRYRRDARAVLGQAQEIIDYTREHGFTDHSAKGIVFRGWASAMLGEVEGGLEEMRTGFESERVIGTKEDFPVFFDMLAELYAMVGRPEPGLTELVEAFTDAHKSGLRYWTAELHRRKGELLLLLPGSHDAEAERCFHSALAMASEQKARSLELRAVLSLARLWRKIGRPDAARERLEPMYEWFTEGFDTADLREAKALLEALG